MTLESHLDRTIETDTQKTKLHVVLTDGVFVSLPNLKILKVNNRQLFFHHTGQKNYCLFSESKNYPYQMGTGYTWHFQQTWKYLLRENSFCRRQKYQQTIQNNKNNKISLCTLLIQPSTDSTQLLSN